jgi:hypothetical protein
MYMSPALMLDLASSTIADRRRSAVARSQRVASRRGRPARARRVR